MQLTWRNEGDIILWMESTPRRPTMKQYKFAEAYLATANITKSAKMAGYSEKSAHVIGNENLKKPTVRQLIEKFSDRAVKNMKKLANKAKSEQVMYYANKDMLDRAGYKPQDEQVGNKTLVINISGESAERYGLLNKVQELSSMEDKEKEKIE